MVLLKVPTLQFLDHSQSHVFKVFSKELKAPRPSFHIARAFAISAIMTKALK